MGPNVSVFSLSFIHVFGLGVRTARERGISVVEEENIFCQWQTAIPGDYRGKFISRKTFAVEKAEAKGTCAAAANHLLP